LPKALLTPTEKRISKALGYKLGYHFNIDLGLGLRFLLLQSMELRSK
jgi:hypothetical protein